MRTGLLAFALVMVSVAAFAQTSLQDQINAVYSVQEQARQRAEAAQLAEQAELRRERQQQAAAARARAAAAAVAERARVAEAEADKKRDQAYQDQLRELNIEEQDLKLQAEKAHVARENEFIDQELKRQAAQTDVIKSQADATRNVSSGVKDYLDQSGAAEVKKESGIFSK